MEAQMHSPHDQEHPQHQQGGGLHSVIEGEGEGEGEHHQEKKSVLNKMKAKAKKIKDSLKHGLSHENELEHEHGHDHDNEEENEDEEEEMVQDPEVHGAPIYESSVMRSATVHQQDDGLGPKSGVNLENPTSKGEDRYDSKEADQGNVRRFVQGQEYPGKTEESLSKPTAMEDHMPEQRHAAPASGTHFTKTSDRSNVQGQEGNVGEPVVEEDPHAPKDRPEAVQPSNYQSKVTDPTGQRGEAAGIAPLVSSFGEMIVEDKTETRPKVESEQKSYTGSHDQFAPQQPISTERQFDPRPIPHKASEGSENPETTPKHFDASKPEEMPCDPVDGKPSGQGTYTDKISSAASAITDKATAVKNVVASKLGYGGTEGSKPHEIHKREHTDVKPSDQSSYTDKISSATSVIADKAAAAKNVVASKFGYGGSEGGTGTANTSQGKAKGTDKGVSMKEYLVEKFRPGEGDKALSEVISDTLQRQKVKTGETGEAKPMEKVTESEEVAKRLGTGKENPREGEDAVIAKGGESQTSQGSPGTPFVNTEGPATK